MKDLVVLIPVATFQPNCHLFDATDYVQSNTYDIPYNAHHNITQMNALIVDREVGVITIVTIGNIHLYAFTFVGLFCWY